MCEIFSIDIVFNITWMNNNICGKYSNGTQTTNIIIHPSDIKNNIYRKDFTHVLWLEKEI